MAVAAAVPKQVPPTQTVGEDFRRRVEALTAGYVELWRTTGDATPRLGPRVGRWRQWRTYRRARRLADRVAAEIERYPEDETERREWRGRVQEAIQRFGEERLGWPGGYRDLLFADEFFDTTVEFVREAKRFDPGVRPDDLGQALRNVWIANSLQMLLDLPVRLEPALFAYSMLYPYTDNYLDDPGIGGADKRSFNRRLGQRLAGEPVAAHGEREAPVFALVARIERQYPRAAFPGVWESLLAIHRAQIGSMAQQRPGPAAAESDLLALSVAKGGTSVLADGYLVAGRLSDEEADFCFGYGVFLQLLDDLQDAREDRRARHWTLFSTAAGRRPLDRLTARLCRFMRRILDDARVLSGGRQAALKDLIQRNCTWLLMGAVGDGPDLFTRPFLSALQCRWPFSFGAARRLRRRIRKRYRETGRRLQRERGVDSLLDLLA